MKKINLFAIVMVFLTGTATYLITEKVKILNNKLSLLNTQQQEYKKDLHKIKTEWHYLNSPENLRKVVESNTKMIPMAGNHLVNYEQLYQTNNASNLQNINF